MPFGPVAIHVSKFYKNHITSSTVQNKNSSSSATGTQFSVCSFEINV